MGVQVPLAAPKAHLFLIWQRLFSTCPAFHNFANISLYKRMKGIKRLLFAFLAPLCVTGAFADDAADIARAASRRTATAPVTTAATVTRQKTTAPVGATISRATSATAGTARERNGGTVSPRGGAVVSAPTRTNTTAATNANVSARTASTVQSRARNAITTSGNTATRSTRPTATASRAAMTTTATRTTAGAAATQSRAATNTIRANTTQSRAASTPTRARAATSAATAVAGNYKKCREVYYDCMDEFCANKDTQLKRCACSSRVNEFDGIKKQLANVDDKMLDFNQRLLTVNMDKEDAVAMFKATEGEMAFNNQQDMSESKKILDEIASKLNTKFDSSNFDQNLSALSWSLNADSAFDTVDSMMGASTTTKSGTGLYSAALPVCREMAMEVCTEDEFAIAQSGYQMAIEQDCNTVAKSFETQTDQALGKIREGAALLDMSRLDIYQKRNSDDILTCKKKMLDMLSDASVCGKDLGRCLDISGRYIDSSTGEAFLTTDLANMNNLITRPSATQTWTTAPGNEKFVTFLNGKKTLLSSAMDNCQDISDYVWDEFLEDALAQIKLAQESKLEDVRQSCTTLTAQCMSDTLDSLADFDARALSTFGVAADKTAKAMCADVQNACSALLDSIGGTEWKTGMTGIINSTTYDTIIKTCREVGRSCIILACKSTSGNFGLCENPQTSVNRKSIISRAACWQEVQKCVENAGEESIRQIMTSRSDIDKDTGAFYTYLYSKAPQITNNEATAINTGSSTISTTRASQTLSVGNNFMRCSDMSIDDADKKNCVYDICATECGYTYDNANGTFTYDESKLSEIGCLTCRLAERIWGNCEVSENTLLEKTDSHNRIKIPTNPDNATLLSWFAQNTGTDNMKNSCLNTACGSGFVPVPTNDGKGFTCISAVNMVNGKMCPESGGFKRVTIFSDLENCCSNNANDRGTVLSPNQSNICCLTNHTATVIGLDTTNTNYFGNEQYSSGPSLCLPDGYNQTNTKLVAAYNVFDNTIGNQNRYLVCLGNITEGTDGENGPKYPKCDGDFVIYTQLGQYYTPDYSIKNNNSTYKRSGTLPVTYYEKKTSIEEQLQCPYDGKSWGDKIKCTYNGLYDAAPNGWLVDYVNENSDTQKN